MDNLIIFVSIHALGDEIHMSRNGLIDLLYKKKISNNIYLVCKKDRKFLYENIFNNIILEEDIELIELKINSLNLIKIKWEDYITYVAVFWKNHSYKEILTKELVHPYLAIFDYQRINYFNDPIYRNNIIFKETVLNINYNNLNVFNDDKYIVYHHRYKNDNHWDQDMFKLKQIIEISIIKNYKLVIFTQYEVDTNILNDNIYITKNLQEYASFIHNKNCIALLSVWSGGGQLGQYCCNSKIIQYFDPIQLEVYNDFINDKINDIWLNSSNAFDFANFSNGEIIFFQNFEKMIENIYNII
jgi:hypothetical protein